MGISKMITTIPERNLLKCVDNYLINTGFQSTSHSACHCQFSYTPTFKERPLFKILSATLASFLFLSSATYAEPPKSGFKSFPTDQQVRVLTEGTVQSPTATTGERYIIRDDPGGSVADFVESLIYAKQKGMKFKIDGYCASACTLILATPLKLDVCVTPKASFRFHQPFAVVDHEVSYSIPAVVRAQALWDNLFNNNYPTWVKDLIKKNGGVPNVYKGAKTSDMFPVSYEMMKNHIPTCQDEVTNKP